MAGMTVIINTQQWNKSGDYPLYLGIDNSEQMEGQVMGQALFYYGSAVFTHYSFVMKNTNQKVR